MRSTDPTFPLYPIMAFLGFVLSLIPLPMHLHAWNSGTCAYMIWTSLSCLVKFIDSIIWAGNLNNNSPIWCDISSKFLVGAAVGIAASALCTTHRLYVIASVQRSYPDKRKMVIIDLCIALGIPFLVMVLHYIVQSHRYDIIEDIGCHPVIYNTLLTYFLVYSWPVVMAFISFVYSALTLRIFWKRHSQFVQLSVSNPSLSLNRYTRLMLLCVTNMFLTIPLVAVWIFLNGGGKLDPWVSWEHVHSDFSSVQLYPAILWRSDRWHLASVEFMRWLSVICAFLSLVIVGYGSDLWNFYKDSFYKCLKSFDRKGIWPKQAQFFVLPSWRDETKIISKVPTL